MNFRNIMLLGTLSILFAGVGYIYIFEPDKPQEFCDFMFSSQMDSYLMGTDLLAKAAAYPRGLCVMVGLAD